MRRLKPRVTALAAASAASILASSAIGQPWGAVIGMDTRQAQLASPVAAAGIEAKKARKANVDAQLAALGAERNVARRRLYERGRALYRISRGGMLPVAGGIQALVEHAARVNRLRHLVTSDLSTLEGLSAKADALRSETARLAHEIEVDEAVDREHASAMLAAARRQLDENLFEQALSTPTEGGGSVQRLPYGTLTVLGGDVAGEQRFVNQRGALALPISGPSQVRDAYRAESDGAGLELVARAGAAVRACASGRVAFADTYGSYGRLVIVDHGERHYTVYGGLDAMDVHVGDEVSRSARLGSVGGDGVLYFEVRRGTRNLLPREWLGL